MSEGSAAVPAAGSPAADHSATGSTAAESSATTRPRKAGAARSASPDLPAEASRAKSTRAKSTQPAKDPARTETGGQPAGAIPTKTPARPGKAASSAKTTTTTKSGGRAEAAAGTKTGARAGAAAGTKTEARAGAAAGTKTGARAEAASGAQTAAQSGKTAAGARNGAQPTKNGGRDAVAVARRTARALPVRSTSVMLAVSLLWLATLLYAAKTTIDAAQQPEEAVDWASLALPAVISASLLSGACAGVVAVNVALRRRSELATWVRWLAGVGTGALTGAVVGGLVLAGYGKSASIVLLAVAVLGAGALGGVLAGLPAREPVVAGLAATLAVFVVEFVLQVFQSPLRGLFGGGASGLSQWNAGTRLAVTQALAGGAAAGLVAFWYLRRMLPTARVASYLAAGALPGSALLLAEAVIRLGGGQVFAAVAGLSESDRLILDYWKNSRLNQALVVLFLGAIVALFCFGRTLPKRRR